MPQLGHLYSVGFRPFATTQHEIKIFRSILGVQLLAQQQITYAAISFPVREAHYFYGAVGGLFAAHHPCRHWVFLAFSGIGAGVEFRRTERTAYLSHQLFEPGEQSALVHGVMHLFQYVFFRLRSRSLLKQLVEKRKCAHVRRFIMKDYIRGLNCNRQAGDADELASELVDSGIFKPLQQ